MPVKVDSREYFELEQELLHHIELAQAHNWATDQYNYSNFYDRNKSDQNKMALHSKLADQHEAAAEKVAKKLDQDLSSSDFRFGRSHPNSVEDEHFLGKSPNKKVPTQFVPFKMTPAVKKAVDKELKDIEVGKENLDKKETRLLDLYTQDKKFSNLVDKLLEFSHDVKAPKGERAWKEWWGQQTEKRKAIKEHLESKKVPYSEYDTINFFKSLYDEGDNA